MTELEAFVLLLFLVSVILWLFFGGYFCACATPTHTQQQARRRHQGLAILAPHERTHTPAAPCETASSSSSHTHNHTHTDAHKRSRTQGQGHSFSRSKNTHCTTPPTDSNNPEPLSWPETSPDTLLCHLLSLYTPVRTTHHSLIAFWFVVCESVHATRLVVLYLPPCHATSTMSDGSVAKGRVQQRRKRPPPLSLAGSASSLASDDGSCEGVPPMLLTPLGSSTSRTKSKAKPLWARRGVSSLTLLEAKVDDVVNDEDLTEVSLTDAEIDSIFSAGTEQLHQLSISESPSSSVASDFTSPWWGAIADPGADAQHTARTARTPSSSSKLASPAACRSVSSSMLKTTGRPALTPTDSGLSVTSATTPACAKVFADKSGNEEDDEEDLHFGFVTAPVPGSFHDDPHDPKGFTRLPTSVTASRRKKRREEREAARLRAMAARAEQEQPGEANAIAQVEAAANQATSPAPACVPKTPAGDSAMVDSASHEVFGFPDEPSLPSSPLSPTTPPEVAGPTVQVQQASAPIPVPTCQGGARPDEDDGLAFLRSANLVDDDDDDDSGRDDDDDDGGGNDAVAERRVSQAMDERAAWSFRCQLGVGASPSLSSSMSSVSSSSSSSWRRPGASSPLAPGAASSPSPPPLSTSSTSSTSTSSTLRSWFGGLRRKTLRKEAAGTSAPSPNVFPGSYDQVWRERAHSMHGGQQQTKRSSSSSPKVSPRRLRRTRSHGESKNKNDGDAGAAAAAAAADGAEAADAAAAGSALGSIFGVPFSALISKAGSNCSAASSRVSWLPSFRSRWITRTGPALPSLPNGAPRSGKATTASQFVPRKSAGKRYRRMGYISR
eukprot:m.371943 g.371943  ORF g.371943 m.371943 type:complete len:837 (-) comp19992_c0_seq13:1201-3711(-)